MGRRELPAAKLSAHVMPPISDAGLVSSGEPRRPQAFTARVYEVDDRIALIDCSALSVQTRSASSH